MIKEFIKQMGYRQILMGFVGVLRDHYIFIFLFGYFLFNPSFKNLGIALLGLLFNNLLMNIVYQLRLYIATTLAFQGRLRKYMFNDYKVNLTEHKVSELMEEEIYEELGSVQLFKIATKGDFNTAIKIYAIDEIDSDTLYSNVVCFERPLSKSYVFLNAPPDKNNFFEKFKVLHEVGHAILSPFLIDNKRQGGVLVAIVFIVLLIFGFDFWAFPLWVIIVLIIVLLSRLIYSFLSWFWDDALNEIFADLFALCSLNAMERKKLSELSSINLVFKNRKMLNIHQRVRERIFKSNLALGMEDDIGEMILNTTNLLLPKRSILKKILWMSFYVSLSYFVTMEQNFITILVYGLICVSFAYMVVFLLNNRVDKELENIITYLKKNSAESL